MQEPRPLIPGVFTRGEGSPFPFGPVPEGHACQETNFELLKRLHKGCSGHVERKREAADVMASGQLYCLYLLLWAFLTLLFLFPMLFFFPREQLRLLQRPRSHIPELDSTNFQGMIEANRKWLEHDRSHPKLYPFSRFPYSGLSSCCGCWDGWAGLGCRACVSALGVQGGSCFALDPSLSPPWACSADCSFPSPHGQTSLLLSA